MDFDTTRGPLRPRTILQTAGVIVIAFCASCTQLKRFAYEGFRRDGWQHPEEVIASLGLQPGNVVADIGSGAGYFTFRFAKAVGASGRVYAVDVDEGLNTYVTQRARHEGLTNIGVVLGQYDDPLLPTGGVDLIFTCNTYHHLELRAAYFANVRKYLRPGGRVAIVEYAGRAWFDKWFGHFTPSETIHSELQEAGYKLDQTFDFLPRQHLLVFSVATE